MMAHPEEILPLSEQRGATGPDIAPPRRLAVIQFSVAPSFGKADIMTSHAALFVNPCPTSKERLAQDQGRLRPAHFWNSPRNIQGESRGVAMHSYQPGSEFPSPQTSSTLRLPKSLRSLLRTAIHLVAGMTHGGV